MMNSYTSTVLTCLLFLKTLISLSVPFTVGPPAIYRALNTEANELNEYVPGTFTSPAKCTLIVLNEPSETWAKVFGLPPLKPVYIVESLDLILWVACSMVSPLTAIGPIFCKSNFPSEFTFAS